MFVTREVDKVRVAGKLKAVKVFEVLAHAGEDQSPRSQTALVCYQKGLQLYKKRAYEEALGMFQRAYSGNEDPVAQVYIERCHKFMLSPPSEDWDGVISWAK